MLLAVGGDETTLAGTGRSSVFQLHKLDANFTQEARYSVNMLITAPPVVSPDKEVFITGVDGNGQAHLVQFKGLPDGP